MAKAHPMQTMRTVSVGAAFGAAAGHYEENAAVQRTVARDLAAMAARERLRPDARILEIGCGTGLLTREIRTLWPRAELIATDLAPEMLAAARGSGVSAQLLTMDGEAPAFDGPLFDLILSSLAFQWFADLPRALQRLRALLRPGASLYFATMGAESFSSWRAAHRSCGERDGIADYPTLDQLRALLAPHGDGAYAKGAHGDAFACDAHYPLSERGGAALIRHFRGLGAQMPRPGYAPLGPAAMRRVIRAYEAAGGQTQYHVLFGRITRAG
jgi:malonyl-CoA O-methyltransferase